MNFILLLFLFFNFYYVHSISIETNDAGAIFDQQADIKLITGRSRIALNINFDSIFTEHTAILHNIAQVEKLSNKITAEFTDGFSQQFISAYKTTQILLESYTYEYDLIASILPSSKNNILSQKSKRSLFPFIGTFHHFLYGTLTEHDKTEIMSNFNDLADSTEKIRSSLNTTVIYIKNIEEQIKNNTEALENVTLRLLLAFESLNTELTTKITFFTTELNKIKTNLQFLTTLTELNTLLHKARLDLITFRRSISETQHSRLSLTLLPPTQLLSILIDLQRKLPVEYSFHTSLNLKNIDQFYNLATTSYFQDETNLILVITIPLISPKNIFNYYIIQSIPFYETDLDVFSQWYTQNNLYINTNNNSYFTSNTELNCVQPGHNTIKLCSHTDILTDLAVQSCETELFFNQSYSKCQRIISKATVPFIKRLRNDVLFSATKPTQITIICYNVNKTITTDTIMLIGHGLILNISSCSFHGHTFILNSHYHINITYNVTLDFKIPLLKGVIPPPIHVNFTNYDVDELKQAIKNLIVTPTTKLPLEKLQEHINQIAVHHYQRKESLLFTFFNFVAMIFFVLLITIIFCYCKPCCCFKNKNSRGNNVRIALTPTAPPPAPIIKPSTSNINKQLIRLSNIKYTPSQESLMMFVNLLSCSQKMRNLWDLQLLIVILVAESMDKSGLRTSLVLQA